MELSQALQVIKDIEGGWVEMWESLFRLPVSQGVKGDELWWRCRSVVSGSQSEAGMARSKAHIVMGGPEGSHWH